MLCIKSACFQLHTANILNINTIANSKHKTALILYSTGKQIAVYNITNGNNDFDIKSLPKGLYIVKVLSDVDFKIFRITK